MLDVVKDGAGMEVSNDLGHRILITEERGTIIVTFPNGASMAGLNDGLMFADENDLASETLDQLSLQVIPGEVDDDS